MKIYFIWLIGVILWNFGFPSAQPIEDVITANSFVFFKCKLKKIH